MTTVAVDLGRTHCRIAVCVDGSESVRLAHRGGAGLHDPGGPRRAADLVERAVARAGFDPVAHGRPWAVGVAVPGAAGGSDLAAELARSIGRRWSHRPEQVVVVSDAHAWHTGALGGGEGAVLAVGTGAVAVRVEHGTIATVDGRGLLLGDEGGGAWIGLRALRAAARSDERSALHDAALHDAAVERFGPRSGWPGLLTHQSLAADLAAFAPDVLRLAGEGHAEAGAVRDAAAAALAATARGAVVPGHPIVLVGGVAADTGLRDRLLALTGDLPWGVADGDGCDGVTLLLGDVGTAMERVLVRHRPEGRTGEPGGTSDVAHEVDHLSTETVHPGTGALETLSTPDLVATLVDAQAQVPAAVRSARSALATASDLAAGVLRGRGRLVYVGAGTPGRLAVQDAAELTPTFGLAPERTLVLLAGGPEAGARAVENAEDDAVRARATVDLHDIGPADVVVGVSASGRTPYVVAAVTRAAERGAATVGISSVPDSPLSGVAAVPVEIETGPEALAGSTRLAAGTAQKIALNTISTAAMVRAGRTYGPWMVDLVATNAKLRRRAVRTVRDATGVDEDAAEEVLAAAGGSVKVALVMLLADVAAPEARDLLERAGSVRAAVTDDAVADDGVSDAGSSGHGQDGDRR